MRNENRPCHRAWWCFAASSLGVLTPIAAQTDWMPARLLAAASTPAMAYDAARGRLVHFGGANATIGPLAPGVYSDATWEHDGTAWLECRPVNRPPARWGHGMAYDAERGKVVLFGGWSANAILSDTWTWDGVDWTLQVVTGPSVRGNIGMAYDALRREVVLFGGADPNFVAMSDTWTWNGTVWTQAFPATSPPVRFAHRMTYDAAPARQQVVLFGGLYLSGGNLVALDDTWTWDGSTWTNSNPTPHPQATGNHGLAYDSARQEVVMFNGMGPWTWTWNGSTWTQEFPPNSPAARIQASMAYHAGLQRAVLVSGAWVSGGAFSRMFSDTWQWDGTDWSLLHPPTMPPERSQHSAAFDPIRKLTVVVGGLLLNGTRAADTWTWNGVGWTERTPLSGPSARQGSAMAHDGNNLESLLFGGMGGTGLLNDTWLYNGTRWLNSTPSASPGARYYHALAWDPVRRQIVLFGGYRATGALADTWTWNGATWTNRGLPPPNLVARYQHAMAWDPVLQQVVLFGGRTTTSALADTWLWNGATWTQPSIPTSPSARYGHSMAHDPGRGTVVLSCGRNPVGHLNEAWDWTGFTWQQLTPSSLPPVARQLATLTEDPLGRMMLFGGEDANWKYGDTWLYGALVRATATSTGVGCAGPSQGVPILTSTEPYLGSRLVVDLLQAPAQSPCFFGFSLTKGSTPFGGGCTLYLGNPFTVLTISNASGFATCGMQVPLETALMGVPLHSQGFTLGPGTPLGLAFSQSRDMVVGS